jgi:16S rRNA (cytosine1402-N4)-methyltransferase
MNCLPSWALSRSEMAAETVLHEPVLLAEALGALQVRAGGRYVDATFGRGGHSQAIAERMGAAGRLLVMDRDPEAVRAALDMFAGDERVSIAHGPFSRLKDELLGRGWLGSVDGLLMDLGVSSPQLDDPQRGFSFLLDGPLDMRMDPGSGENAADWLARASEAEVSRVLRDYGEERFHRRIARAIVEQRREAPILTTGQLAAIVARAVPTREPGKHPATRSFQAIRIFINRELEEIDHCLAEVPDMLAPRGRLVVMSFHSLEDRRVKRFIRGQARGDPFPSDLPVRRQELKPRLRQIDGAIHPGERERSANPRARSAVMRVAEKLP